MHFIGQGDGEEPLPSCRFASSHPLPTLSLTRHLSPAGESLSKGTALAAAGNFAAAPKGVPLGELALRSKD